MTAPAAPPRMVHAAPADAARVVSLTAMLVVVVLALSPVGDGPALAWAVLAIGLLIGLPHGAVDHLVPSWAAGAGPTRRPSIALLAGYVGVAALAFAALQWFPVLAAGAFLGVSVWHFGTGDLAVHEQDAGRVPGPRWLTAAAFGLPPIALPIAVHAEHAEPVLVGLAPGLAVLTADEVRAAAMVATLLAVGATVFLAVAVGRTAVVVDLLVLLVTFVVTPPLLAFAAYFGLWHATRHIARLLALDPRNEPELARGLLLGSIGRFARAAAWPTLVSVLALLGLWWGAGGVEGLVAAHLGLLVALTMPHVALVAWLDRRGRTARTSEAAA